MGIAALCCIALTASAINVRATLGQNPDGVYSTSFPCVLSDRSDCAPPTTAALSCDDSAAPSLVGLVTGNAYSASVRQYFSGTAAATATLSVVTVSGDNAASEGWAISSAGAGNNLTHSGTGTGAGALKIRGTTSGNSVDCAVRAWSYIDAPASDSTAPTFPTGLTMTAGSNSCTFEFDASSDPYVGEAGSGVDEYDLRCGTSVVHTLTNQSPGLSKQFTLTNIGTSTPAPSGTQSGASWDLSGGGAGFHGTTNQFPFWHASVPGTFSISGKVTSFAPTVQAFSATGFMAMESAAAGAKFFACYKQESDHSVQCKARTATNGSAINVATITSITGDVWVRISGGSSWTGEYSINGNDWLPIVTNYTDLVMAATVQAGFFITSRTDGSAVTATLSNVNLNNIARLFYSYTTGSACSASVRARDADANNSIYSSAVACTPSAPAVPEKKWHPGNYMLLFKGDTDAGVTRLLERAEEIKNESQVKGMMIRIPWSSIESTQGNYNWDVIDQVLQRMQTNQKHLWIMLLDRTFGTTPNANACLAPTYVKDLGGTGQGCAASKNGGLPRVWRQDVMDRFIAFSEAFCARYDTEPYMEGFIDTESVPGFGTQPEPDDYSLENLHRELRRYATAVGEACPRLNFLQSLNYPTTVSPWSTTVGNLVTAGVGIGGPDICPGSSDCIVSSSASSTTTAQKTYMGFDGGVDYRGDMPAGWQGQQAGLGNAGLTFAEVYDSVFNQLRQHYMFWPRITATHNLNWPTTVLVNLRTGNYPTRTTCPTNYAGGCDTD